MSLKDLINEFTIITIPLITAIVTASSTFYIFTQMGWPYPKEAVAIAFVLTFINTWGSDKL